jgi:hypothetical protein
MANDESPLLPASQLSDKDVAEAMVAGRVFWSGNRAADLGLFVRTNHPVLKLCCADPRHPVPPVVNVLVFLATLFVDFFYASQAAMFSSENHNWAFLYFLICLNSLSSNLINFVVTWITTRAEMSEYTCMKFMGRCCACSCCCYMLLAAFGVSIMNFQFCPTPSSITVSSLTSTAVPLARGGSIDLGGTYHFAQWTEDVECGSSFPAFLSADETRWLVHIFDLSWGSNATTGAYANDLKPGYWLFSEALDSVAPPWSPYPDVYALSPDTMSGGFDKGLTNGPIDSVSPPPDCSSGAGGCWFAFTSNANDTLYPPRQPPRETLLGPPTLDSEAGSFDRMDTLVLSSAARLSTIWDDDAFTTFLFDFALIFIIGHCQSWFTWFLFNIPMFMMRFEKEQRRVADVPVKESELIGSTYVQNNPYKET